MPTNLDRIQTLLQPDAFAKVRTLAKHNRRALSAMSAELVEAALKLPKYRDQLQEADVQVPVKEDPRTVIKQTAIASRELVDDGKGGLIDPNLTEDEVMHMDLKAAQQAAPVFTYEEQEKLFEMVRKGEISKEEMVRIMSYETPAPGQTKEELQADKRTDLLKTIGEQDERLKRMEEMMAKLAAKL